MPDPGPWSGAAWEFVKKQKQRKQPGNALAFELISTAAWRVLQGFLACSLQTAQTVMKSSLTRTHARAMCASMCRIYLSIQSASSIYPSRLPRLYLCIYRGNTAEPHSCWHSSERTCPLRKAESLSKFGLIICGWGLFFHLMCLFSYLSLTPLGTGPLEPIRSSSVRYTAILRSVSLIIVYDAQYLWGFIKALHQAAGRKKKQAVPSSEHKVEGERGTERRPFKAFKAFWVGEVVIPMGHCFMCFFLCYSCTTCNSVLAFRWPCAK